MGISETIKVGIGRMILSNKYSLYHTWVAVEQRAKEGVEIMITVDVETKVTEVEPLSLRIIYIGLGLNYI